MSGVKLSGQIVIRAVAAGKALLAKKPGGEIASNAAGAEKAVLVRGLPPKPERGRLMAGRLGFIAFKPGKTEARRSRVRGRIAAGSAFVRRHEFASSAVAPVSFPPTGKERTPPH